MGSRQRKTGIKDKLSNSRQSSSSVRHNWQQVTGESGDRLSDHQTDERRHYKIILLLRLNKGRIGQKSRSLDKLSNRSTLVGTRHRAYMYYIHKCIE